ncbi:TPA_exp: putative FAD binding oxidoreductase [Trichophyton benhamiae CBS 112371]|uniref:FAD binding oxidoreductase, putative n=1 Tax=Arthroderma benhamiae (strain ATCC MYA-4681 / CBS 112371) TaxID=663331 RepID=D4B1P1_ARTBC|nr:FAD binding oxidoreductase, putative [Trichophyton benhamiae CBS 112371]EFE30673.1 FAD binding oxidoreductase, putative [Trichophyton benhamiae CBS 112371]DAA73872.1 TPA_exp: putative FAD binding oxidoreductase [Trichophyton benhamiae CBS 112371]
MSLSKNPISAELIEILKSQVKSSEVLTPSSAGYSKAIARWSNAAVKPAGAVLLATNAEDVSAAVKFAQQYKLDLAVKGGGHSVSGTSSSDGGLVIDLSRMRHVEVDAECRTITAQGGCLWVDVDEAGGQHGLATVGGTVNHTGIGGLTLGGGYGWLSSKYGLVIDNVLSVTMVLADGRIVKTSATEEPDLFWAVRGAGHNFGVAVEFVYQAYEQADPVFSGFLIFPQEKLEAIVDTLNRGMQHPQPDSSTMCIFGTHPGTAEPMVATCIFHRGTEEEGREAFKDLYAIGPVMDGANMIPYSTVNAQVNEMAKHGARRNIQGLYFSPPLRPAFARSVMDKYAEKMAADPDMMGTAVIFEYFDMRKCTEVPIESTSCANRGATLNGLLTSRWNDKNNDSANRQWGRDMQQMFVKEMEQSTSAGSTNEVPQYINYSESSNMSFQKMHGIHAGRLQKLKGEYDPTGMFGKMCPIMPTN